MVLFSALQLAFIISGDPDNGRILVIIDMPFTHGRPLLTMTSTRLVSSSFSETRIRVGCPVSRACKTWSRSFIKGFSSHIDVRQMVTNGLKTATKATED